MVNGNIYIRPGVTELSGDYIATGTIYTCLPSGVSPGANTAAARAAYATACDDNQLFVYGNFIAPTIKFLRLANTVNDSAPGQIRDTSMAGEVFIQSPENWFTDVEELIAPVGGFNGKFDAVTALPPLL